MNFTLTDQNYDAFVAQGKPMVIDFAAEWCGPCKKMAPIIEELAAKYDGKVTICSCNVDDNEALTEKFEIRNIPAIFFLKDGQIVDRVIGAVPASTIEEKVQALL